MTTITDLNHSIDMTKFNLNDVKTGTIVRHDTAVTITGAGGVYTYTFTGSGFGEGSGLPSGGTLTGVSVVGTDGTNLTITDFTISVSSLFLIFAFGTFVDFENALLGHSDTINASTGNDNLFGYNGDDTFVLSRGGDDIALGQGGSDTFRMAGALTSADQIDGGDGKDTVALNGDYSHGVTFNATTMVNVENISLGDGFNYKLTTNNATVAAGSSLTVDGSALAKPHLLNFNGAAETDGTFKILGGAGKDHIVGGSGDDTIKGGLGADSLKGGGGSDTFVYASVADSKGTAHDTIIGFDVTLDHLNLPVTVSGIDANRVGALSTASFDSDMATILTAARLGANHAAVVTANGGGLDGKIFLVVDGNHTAGYQADGDYVIQLTSPTSTHFNLGDFI